MADKQKRESEILAAACRVFRERGFHHSRMADVARAAGTSYGLVYHYYGSKEDLFDAILAGWWEGLDRLMDRDVPAAATIDTKLGAVISYFLDRYEAEPDLVHIFITEISRSTTNLTPARLRAFQRFINHMGEIFAEAQRAGDLRRDIKARYLATFFLGALETFVTTMVLADQPLKGAAQKRRITEQLLTHFFDGARPRGTTENP